MRIVAVSVDPVGTNERHSKKMGYTFPLLADSNAQVIRRYDLLHPGAGPGKSDIARPAEFLVDGRGTIRWENLTENAAVRVRPEQVLKTFDELNGKTSE